MKKVCLCACAAVVMAISSVRAEFHPVDLGEFVGPSGFDAMEAQLAIPIGDQIITDIPYCIDGLVQLDGCGPRAAGQNYPT